MTTLIESREITEANGKLYEVIEHNGRKFSINIYGMNGNFCGFNSNCCLKVMTNDGVFANVVDNITLNIPFHNDTLYYGRNIAEKKKEISNLEKSFKFFIEKVY